jgi:flavin-dependent dehydrogenase
MSESSKQQEHQYDVAIIGGGPGGSTLGTLLRKYDPTKRVIILEKERFPRDHVGESQLPGISAVLNEMGCWDKVEAADFPVKIGATFRWGKTPELWDFDFLPAKNYKHEARPGKYAGQRLFTAFQVDRAIYDTILLRHAESMGCEVREETQVTNVLRDGDRVTGFELRGGEVITAKHYIDASGHIGVMRRAMGVESEVPTRLQNIAIWYYWQNAEWATHIGTGGTRIQVMSLSDGWIWFIPLGPTRTSLGFVCPQEYYKQTGKTPDELYRDALAREPRISALLKNATSEGKLYTTKDWSFISQRTYGENWFLVGESAGFADPILSAGLTLTHTGARELAYIILALDRGEHDPAWLKSHYDFTQRARVHQHIRFADYWYAINGQLLDLRAHCQQIAADSGLKLTPEAAWRWLAQGGFTHEILDQAAVGSFDIASMKHLTQMFSDAPAKWQLSEVNVLRLNLEGAREETVPAFHAGKIHRVQAYTRGAARLPMVGMWKAVVDLLRVHGDIEGFYQNLAQQARSKLPPAEAETAVRQVLQVLEVLLNQGFVTGTLDPNRPVLKLSTAQNRLIHPNEDPAPAAARAN